MIRSFIVVFVVLLAALVHYCAPAYAGTYVFGNDVDCIGGNSFLGVTPPGSADTPFAMAALAVQRFSPCAHVNYPFHHAVIWREAGFVYVGGLHINTGGAEQFHGARIVAQSGGDPCFETNKLSMTQYTRYTPSTLPTALAACNICPEGQDWNDTEQQCQMPECEDGEVYDEQIDACRPQCEENEVFIYQTEQCKLQCSAGKTAAWGYLGNKPLNVEGEVFTVNGCPATAHVNCQADTEGLIAEKFGTAHVTGQFCKIHFVYTQEIEQTVEFQVVYEDELPPGVFGYSGEGGAKADLAGEVQEPEVAEWHDYSGSLDPFISSNWKYVCENGTAAWVYQLDGVEGQHQIVGACPVNDAEVSPDAAAPQAVQAQLQGLAENQDEQTGILDEIRAALTSLTDGETELNLNWGTWSDPGDPEKYTKEHEDGLEGVVAGVPDLAESDVAGYLNSIVPDFSAIEVEECMSFVISTPWFGDIPFEPYCPYWDLIKYMVITMALVSAWSIIFVRS